MARDILQIEIAHEDPATNGYFYSYLDLPASEHHIRDALQKARITGSGDGFYDIRINSSPDIQALRDVRLDSSTIDEMNFLAKRIQAMNWMQRTIYEAVAKKLIEKGEPVSMKDLINATYNLDEVPVAADISNDAQLGAFVIENEMHRDVDTVPADSLYLLDRTKIGEMYRTNSDAVYSAGMCIFTGHYEMPEIYDGKQLPEAHPSSLDVFRLLVAVPLDENSSKIHTEWISLPIDKNEANRIATLHGESCIERCSYDDFISSVPQIHLLTFQGLLDFDKLNRLAAVIQEMPETDQVKFKAVLCAEKPTGIYGALDIAEHLHQYEIDTSIADEDVFFRRYLAHHLDPRFDTEWLNTLYTRAEGGDLLRRLGAAITDFGVVSARGRSLHDLVPCKQQTVQETVPTNERMHVVEILGQTALFTNTKLTMAELPDGLYMYDFWESGAANHAVIQNHTDGHFGGRMLSKVPLNLGGMKPFIFDKDTYPNFLGYGLTPTEFMETSLTQTEDEPEQAEEPRLGGI